MRIYHSFYDRVTTQLTTRRTRGMQGTPMGDVVQTWQRQRQRRRNRQQMAKASRKANR